MEVYNNFGGGLNIVIFDDNLKDFEFMDFVNVDLVERGSVKWRIGMVVDDWIYRIILWSDIGIKKWSDL